MSHDGAECAQVSWTRSDGSVVPGYAAGAVSAPAVIVIQEWWGVNEQILAHARAVASQGCLVG